MLALQGGFESHRRVFERLDVESREVRVPDELDGLDALVIPGGESTTMTLGVDREGLAEPIREKVRGGLPVLGTCAGMIMLDRDHLDLMDFVSRRNAFGRQTHSFEADVDFEGIEGDPLRAVFIRAPWIDDHGSDVTVVAEVDGKPVGALQENRLAVAFHPELTDDSRLHEFFLGLI